MSNKKFNHLADFVAGRALTLNGEYIGAGKPFDKSLVGIRRLRQMWEARRIVYGTVNVTERVETTEKITKSTSKLPSGNKIDTAPQATIAHDGGPWYTVTFADGTTEKVKGKKKAEALING